jgi:hypothetical protein
MDCAFCVGSFYPHIFSQVKKLLLIQLNTWYSFTRVKQKSSVNITTKESNSFNILRLHGTDRMFLLYGCLPLV